MSVCVESGRDPTRSPLSAWLAVVGPVFRHYAIKLWWKPGRANDGVVWWRGLLFGSLDGVGGHSPLLSRVRRAALWGMRCFFIVLHG